ncbi:hypothetical protein Hanom_Chr09g00826951 [Helianthus anomalus]
MAAPLTNHPTTILITPTPPLSHSLTGNRSEFRRVAHPNTPPPFFTLTKPITLSRLADDDGDSAV